MLRWPLPTNPAAEQALGQRLTESVDPLQWIYALQRFGMEYS
jgi:hypothetical protein